MVCNTIQDREHHFMLCRFPHKQETVRVFSSKVPR